MNKDSISDNFGMIYLASVEGLPYMSHYNNKKEGKKMLSTLITPVTLSL